MAAEPSLAPLRAVVVDDEPLARDELAHLLAGTGRVQVVGEAASGEEALDVAARLRPDVVFLDVQMPGQDGFAVAGALLAWPQRPQVVFVTAYDEYALKAFEYHAVDYLLKPVDPQRLARTVAHLQRTLAAGEAGTLERLEAFLARVEGARRPARVPVEREGRVLLLAPGEILYAAAAGEGALVRTASGEYRTAMTLQQLEARLEPYGFLRVHRQYLVNLEKVREFVPWFSGTALLVLGEKPRIEVPVARREVRRVRQALGLE